MAKPKAVKLKITKAVREQFGEAFHTGLRKGVDSQYSSLAWHAIKICPAPVWASFCKHMLSGPGYSRPKTMTFEMFDSNLRHYGEHRDAGADARTSEAMVFRRAMSEMPADDAKALFMWLLYGFDQG